MSSAAEAPGSRLRRLGERLRAAAERLVFASAAYRVLLLGAAPAALASAPGARPGDARQGAAILAGQWTLAGETIAGDDPFAAAVSEDVLRELHGFAWLADVMAVDSDAAREKGRALVSEWIARHGEWSPLAWRGDVLGRRIAAWLAAYEALTRGADDAFRKRLLRSIARQLRHLGRLAWLGGAALAPAGHGRLEALIADVTATACLPGRKDRLVMPAARLLAELDVQVLPDGGHYQRSPATHLAALALLVELRGTLLAGRHGVPAGLQATIDRMAPMLRFFRHGDGRLALFNHTGEGDAQEIDAVLARADAVGKPPPSAPHTGFQRLEAGSSLVLMDTGPPPPPGSEAYAHAGTLSFELSYGKERVIVNCGARPRAKGEWLMAQRATAAHSTLVLADTNSCDFLSYGRIGRRPRHVLARREEADGAILVDASHDGYEPPFHVLHRRRLYLASGGEDLRGEDRLARLGPGREPLAFAVRFHLHPEVQASLVQDGKAVLLRTPGRMGFRLDAAGGRLAIAESVYLGGSGGVRRSEQIVIESTLAGEEAAVKWSLKRVGTG